MNHILKVILVILLILIIPILCYVSEIRKAVKVYNSYTTTLESSKQQIAYDSIQGLDTLISSEKWITKDVSNRILIYNKSRLRVASNEGRKSQSEKPKAYLKKSIGTHLVQHDTKFTEGVAVVVHMLLLLIIFGGTLGMFSLFFFILAGFGSIRRWKVKDAITTFILLIVFIGGFKFFYFFYPKFFSTQPASTINLFTSDFYEKIPCTNIGEPFFFPAQHDSHKRIILDNATNEQVWFYMNGILIDSLNSYSREEYFIYQGIKSIVTLNSKNQIIDAIKMNYNKKTYKGLIYNVSGENSYEIIKPKYRVVWR